MQVRTVEVHNQSELDAAPDNPDTRVVIKCQLRREGGLQAYKIGPRLWRISKRELMEQMGVMG